MKFNIPKIGGLKFLLAIILFCCITSQLTAQYYYVAKDGKDDNDGSIENPFLTISRAASVMTAGDTCFVKAGVYRETVNPTSSGNANSPIVFKNFENDSVVIAATEPLSDWSHHSGDIYRAKVDMLQGVNHMVYANQKAMDWARWPNNTDNDVYTIQADSVMSGTASSITSANGIPDIDWTGGYIWYLGAHSGTSWTRKIMGQTEDEVSFTPVDITKWPFTPHNPTIFRHGNRGRFYLFGVYEALDYEREWYFDANKDSLYFQAPGNVDPSTLSIEVAQREQTIYITGSYVVFDGIDAFGGKIEIAADYCELKNGHFLNCLQVLDELDNTDAQVANGAIHIKGGHNLIEYNIIENSSLNGIYIQGWGRNTDFTVIRNNHILNSNMVGVHSTPIRADSDHHKILSNTINGTGRDGITLKGIDSEVAYNDVSNCMKINNDGGIFYTVGNSDLKNNEIHHNWFHDSYGPFYADGRAAAIYLDNNSKGYNVHHNVIWNVTWSGLQINWNNTHIDFFNNTLIDCGQATGRWANGFVENNNRVWNNYSTAGSWSSDDFQPELKTNLIASSGLQGPENHDFMPAANSGLVDKGTTIDGITDNAVGIAPDIGAYERGRTPWVPGVNTVLGNIVDSSSIVLSIANETQMDPDILIYPNPIYSPGVNIEIKNAIGAIEVQIYTISGKRIYRSLHPVNKLTISKSIFNSPGLYLIHFRFDNQYLIKKMVVN